MAKLNMVKVSTLIRKGYLLAGVIMAANMFVVNEMKASANESESEDNKLIDMVEKDEGKKTLFLENVLNFVEWVLYYVLSYENSINFIGGAVFSGANNYFKWWDYNPGKYSKLGCFGWRSGRLIKDIFQVDININLGRSILWLITSTYNFIKGFTKGNNRFYVIPLHFSFLVAAFINDERWSTPALILSFLVQSFVSAPLAIHISNFSISISLDSMLWAGIGKILYEKQLKKEEEEYKNMSENLNNEEYNI